MDMGIHTKTPRLTVIGPRGLSIRSVEYWRAIENQPAEARINRTVHDGAGRAVKQWDPRLWALQVGDPLTPANLTTAYSLTGSALRTDSVDAGTQINLHGLAAEVVLGWDRRETRREVEYDDLLRPVAVFEQGAVEPRRCVERFTYGYPGQGNRDRNQCGQLIRHDDPAGSVLFDVFAISGQCVENTRHFTLDPVTPDWPESIDDRRRLLEPGIGATSRWRFGPLGDVLEQIDTKGNHQAFSLTLDGRLRETRLQLQGLATWQTLVSDIQYNAEGKVTHETAGNAVQTTLVYRTEDGLLMERRAQDASARLLQHLIYGYDRMGNVLRIEDKALPIRYFANRRIDPISRFRYDSRYQLIEAFGWEAGGANQGPDSVGRIDPAAVSNYRQTYSYDAGGNLLTLTHVGTQNHGRKLKAARYSNRCLPWRNDVPPTEDEIAAAFDAKGNLLELDQGCLTWDLRNQLLSVCPVARASGRNDREAYLYDGTGQRVRKIRSLQTNARTVIAQVRYLPGLELRTDNGTGEVLQVITAQAGLNTVRVLHWESLPPSGTNNQYRYGFTDHLGSTSLELAADARIISQEAFYPFGETACLAGGDVIEVSYKTVRYSGKERDATGLYYFGYRYYIPWLQRWVNPDPKGFIDGPNLYCMVGNSPMRYVDSDGGGKTEAQELNSSMDTQQALLTSVTTQASNLRNSMLNHVYPRHRLQALGRRVVTQLGSHAVSAGAQALGAAGGSAVGGLLGPGGSVLGGKLGTKVGAKAADALISKVVDTYQLDRPINFKGNEMNPKALIESVEPKKHFSLAMVKLKLAANDPRTSEGRARLGKKIRTVVTDKVVEKVGDKLGSQASGLIKTGQEFYQASKGLNAASLSETYEVTPAVIDMLEFRTQAIKNEFADSGSTDPQTFETIAEISMQTQEVVQVLNRNQDFIELVAPKPYAGRRQSLNGTSRSAPARQVSVG